MIGILLIKKDFFQWKEGCHNIIYMYVLECFILYYKCASEYGHIQAWYNVQN